MYLIDTNVISEARKKGRANSGVTAFFKRAAEKREAAYLSAITVGELRRGVELIRHRGDRAQAAALEAWLVSTLEEFGENVLTFGADEAQVWGRLRVPRDGHAIDRQIAAIALLRDLTVVTRNLADFAPTGVRVLNPFEA